MEPVYSASRISAAYQLRWSLAVFAKSQLPSVDVWLPELKEAVERDNVRILEVTAKPRDVWQFYLSTTPDVAPPEIVKSVKGRLQHRLRPTNPDCFRRNFLLSSVGNARRQVVEDYVASQLAHHRMADLRAQKKLEEFQIKIPEVDLGAPQLTAHAAYVYGLHLVLVHDGRWNEVRANELSKTRDMVLRVARTKEHRVSRLSLLADHLHLVAAIPPKQSPQDVALSYMNNVAHAHDMQAVFCPSFYVGTVGDYDTGAIWTSLRSS